MPSSTTENFTDPDEFHVAIRGAEIQLLNVEPADFRASLTILDLGGTTMQSAGTNLRRTFRIAQAWDYISVLFRTKAGPPLIWDGAQIGEGTIVIRGPGAECYVRTNGPTHWAAVSIAQKDLPGLSSRFFASITPAPYSCRILQPSEGTLNQLKILNDRANRMAAQAPDLFAQPQMARALGRSLAEAITACLLSSTRLENAFRRFSHKVIMDRFTHFFEDNPDMALNMQELCHTIGVPQRTLQLCCQEFLGMSPGRYLRLRRFHLARQALCSSNPADTSVTDIATHYGFWEFGRFAAQYRSLFGELPSATLKRAPTPSSQPDACAFWLNRPANRCVDSATLLAESA